MTCDGAEEVVSQVKVPWGSESDRQSVRLDISFEAPANAGLRTAELSLRSLFMDFLHFFGCVIDPRHMCVHIRAGGIYVSCDRGFSIDPLYIEDPFDFENNVGSTCFRIQQIVKAFADAHASLEKELFEGSLDGTKAGENFTLLQRILPSMAGK